MSTFNTHSLHITEFEWHKSPPDEWWFLVNVRMRQVVPEVHVRTPYLPVVAWVPRLPECISRGLDIDHALVNIKEALQGCLESYLESGSIPWLPESDVPARQPFEEDRSVKIVVKRRTLSA